MYDAGVSRRSWQDWLGIAGLALALVLALHLLAAAWPFTTDDAYISLRYARSLADGQGLRFNPGEPPLEGYSNFLFVLIGAAVLRLGGDPVLALKLAGCAGLLATLVVLHVLARRVLGPAGAASAPLLFGTLVGGPLWGVSGLETTVYAALVAGALLAYLGGAGWEPGEKARQGAPSPSLWALAGGLAFLASLVRCEGPLVFAALAVAAAVDLGGRWRAAGRSLAAARPHLALALAFALPYVAYSAWRVATFGSLLPNSVLCKAHWQGDPWVLHRDLVADAWPLLLLALVAIARWPPRLDARLGLPLGFFALYAVILRGADPIIGYGERHFLAALALLAVVAAVGLVRVVSLFSRFLAPAGQEVAALALGALVALALQPRLGRELGEQGRLYARRSETRTALGDWLKERLRPGEAYVVGDAGLLPYRAGGRVLDALCLNSREMTRPPIDFSSERWAQWALAQRPRFVLIPSHDPRRFQPHLQPAYPTLTDLVRDPRFRARYRVAAVFATPDDDFNYFVFEANGPPGD